MSFEYIWGILVIRGNAPDSEMFTALKNEYKFFPFVHTGPIFTFDTSIWNVQGEHSSMSILWPDVVQFENLILDNDKKSRLIVAFGARECVSTIKKDEGVNLYKIPTYLRDYFLENFTQCGYDVVDVAGLSALTNIGYASDDVSIIQNKNIVINKYGLIDKDQDAIKFSDLASHLSSEHAPFFPVCVWSNL